MREIGVFKAKNKLGQLLDWVDAGKEVVLTRRGRVVARLVPPHPAADPEQASNAAAAIRAMSKGVTLGGLKVKEWLLKATCEPRFPRVKDASDLQLPQQ